MKTGGSNVVVVDAKVGETPVAAESTNRAHRLKLVKSVVCVSIPLAIWLAPLSVAANIKGAFAISAFMILAWMTELMEYASAGLFGLLLFWFFGIAKPEVIFSGFINDSAWFYLGAMLIGAMAMKSGLPQRVGNFVITRVGATYSRLLLGLIIVEYLLTFVVPSGAAVVVIMASITMGVMRLFDAERGSNIGRGLFVAITYTTTIFNKMIIAGTAAIMSRSIMQQSGGVMVSWGLWFAAFLPTALVTIVAAWWFTLKLFPPEETNLEGGADRVKAHFSRTTAWTTLSVKAALLSALTLILWMTDWLHGVSASIVAFGAGLCGLLPFVDVLDEKDFKRINLLPFFFVAAALGMGEVLKVTGGLKILTDNFVGGLEPLLANKAVALPALYWGGFLYHFVTASEISMLVTSLPVLMDFAKSHNLDPAWIGMIWSFSSGGKLFAYQSAVLVLGYGYGYFRPGDLIKLGVLLTVVDFVVLALSVAFYWPLLGL